MYMCIIFQSLPLSFYNPDRSIPISHPYFYIVECPVSLRNAPNYESRRGVKWSHIESINRFHECMKTKSIEQIIGLLTLQSLQSTLTVKLNIFNIIKCIH